MLPVQQVAFAVFVAHPRVFRLRNTPIPSTLLRTAGYEGSHHGVGGKLEQLDSGAVNSDSVLLIFRV